MPMWGVAVSSSRCVAAQSSAQRGSPPGIARERLGDPITVRLADREVGLAVGRELVALVEDAQVVGLDRGFLEPGEGSLAGQRIDADDERSLPDP